MNIWSGGLCRCWSRCGRKEVKISCRCSASGKAPMAVKYLIRYKLKWKPLEDLRKAQAYLNKLIEEETNGFTGSDKE
ncbi:MAG TPA: hypothetical protein ENK96_10595 [Desulfobulbaceae bacterium]|nr:hypothetical protein [Desulfobulbaceae bacterium]